MIKAFIDKNVISKSHITLFTATQHEDGCCFEGMKRSFQEVAGAVGERGLFIFQFSGHGLSVKKEGDGQFGLVPADFDMTTAKFITGSVLNQWLIDSKCKACHVVYILDCCYAGGLGTDVTAGVPNLRSGLYVLSASTALEASLVIQPLGNSLFTYFLAYAIRKFQFVCSTLPISKIFEECRELCVSVSSLMITYHGPHCGLMLDKFRPELQFFDVTTGKDLDQTVEALIEQSTAQSSVKISPHHPMYMFSKFSFVMKYYRVRRQWWSKGKGPELSEICRSWLLFTTGSLSPLSKLAERDLLNNEVLSAAVCLMLWSIASIQIAAKNQKSAVDPNTFLVGFLYAAAALDSFHSCPVTLKELAEALKFYHAVLKVHELDDTRLQQLYQEIKRDLGAQEIAERERPSQIVGATLSRIKTDSEDVSVEVKPEKTKYQSTLEPILEESTMLSMSTSAAVSSSEPKTKQSPIVTEFVAGFKAPKLFGASRRTVEIPKFTSPSTEVETESAWQTSSTSIVPSLKKNSVRTTLQRQISLPAELLKDRTVCADTLALQTLQVS